MHPSWNQVFLIFSGGSSLFSLDFITTCITGSPCLMTLTETRISITKQNYHKVNYHMIASFNDSTSGSQLWSLNQNLTLFLAISCCTPFQFPTPAYPCTSSPLPTSAYSCQPYLTFTIFFHCWQGVPGWGRCWPFVRSSCGLVKQWGGLVMPRECLVQHSKSVSSCCFWTHFIGSMKQMAIVSRGQKGQEVASG